MKLKRYTMNRKVTISYSCVVTARNKAEAIAIADDWGVDKAKDGVTDTGWKAKLEVGEK